MDFEGEVTQHRDSAWVDDGLGVIFGLGVMHLGVEVKVRSWPRRS